MYNYYLEKLLIKKSIESSKEQKLIYHILIHFEKLI